MMHLYVDCEGVVLQAFDQIIFPQRAGAIERLFVQPRDEFSQLGQAPRLRQRDMANVVVEIDIAADDPGGMVEAEGRRRQPAKIGRQQIEAIGGMLAKRSEQVDILGAGLKIVTLPTCIGVCGVST